jgi:hypothetical protein
MERERIFTKLQQFTGKLKPGDRTTTNDLHELEKALVTHLARDENFSVIGERLHHESAEHLEMSRETSFDRFARLEPVIEAAIADEEYGVAPLVFRRTTAFQSNLIGIQFLFGASGWRRVTRSGRSLTSMVLVFGSISFSPKRMISVCFEGNITPVLLIPFWGTMFSDKILPRPGR